MRHFSVAVGHALTQQRIQVRSPWSPWAETPENPFSRRSTVAEGTSVSRWGACDELSTIYRADSLRTDGANFAMESKEKTFAGKQGIDEKRRTIACFDVKAGRAKTCSAFSRRGRIYENHENNV